MATAPSGYRRWRCYAAIGFFLRGSARFGVGPGLARIDVVGLLGWLSGVRYIDRHDGRVVVVRFALRPPWMSTTVYLDKKSRGDLGLIAARRVTRALVAAGFEVDRHNAWLMTPRAIDFGGLHAERIRRP